MTEFCEKSKHFIRLSIKSQQYRPTMDISDCFYIFSGRKKEKFTQVTFDRTEKCACMRLIFAQFHIKSSHSVECEVIWAQNRLRNVSYLSNSITRTSLIEFAFKIQVNCVFSPFSRQLTIEPQFVCDFNSSSINYRQKVHCESLKHFYYVYKCTQTSCHENFQILSVLPQSRHTKTMKKSKRVKKCGALISFLLG